MLIIFSISIYAYCRREGTKLAQFLLLIFLLEGVLNLIHLAGTLFVFDFPLGASDSLLCFMLVLQKLSFRPARHCGRFSLYWFSCQQKATNQVYYFQFDVIRCPNKIFQYFCVCFVSVRFMCHVYCALLFLFVCCAVSFIGHWAVVSALQ